MELQVRAERNPRIHLVEGNGEQNHADNVEVRILCNDDRKMPSSRPHFPRDFFMLCPTETLDTSTLSADRTLNFLPLNGLKVLIPEEYLGFSRFSIEIKL